MLDFKNNLLAQFSVVTFVIMVILGLVVSMVLIEILNRNLDLMKDHNAALLAGRAIMPSDPFSILRLSNQVSNLKWITLAAIGGSFVYLYGTLVYMVWEGWRTIVGQRGKLESTNAQLETRVNERVAELKEVLEQGHRRLDAFRTAAGRLALEVVPERALLDLVDVARNLVGARYAALALPDSLGDKGKLVTSGISVEQQARIARCPEKLDDLGLVRGGNRVYVSNVSPYLSAHGFLPHHFSVDSFLGVAVAVKGRTSGALYVMEKEGGSEFTDDDERLLNLFAVLAGVHFENVRLYEEVGHESSKLAAIQASMTEGLIVLGQDATVMYLNETAESLWELNADAVRGKSLREVFEPKEGDFESPKVSQDIVDVAERALDSPAKIEITLIKPQKRHLEVTVFPIPAAPGQRMTGLFARDVTEEVEHQERRNAFVSIASHELRTPMTAVMGFSEMLLRNDVAESSRREWLQRIYKNSQVLSSIVDDMLNVSRIHSGKLALNLEHVELESVVGEVLAGVAPEANGHEFVVVIPPGTPQVVADREKLDQVLINLLTNAAKYSPQSGRITLSARHSEEEERVVVKVEDEGIGIAPDDQKQLFNTFYRIRRPETEGVRGTGLGLSIVRGLVMMMRGEVWVESELNKGSSFFFSIPTRRVDMEEGAWEAAIAS